MESMKAADVLARLNKSLRDLYHAATPSYPAPMHQDLWEEFDTFLADAASQEVDYLNSGGACGMESYEKMRHVQEQAAVYVGKDRAAFLAAKRADYLRDRDAGIESRICDYGKIYAYGRGGRTVAPAEWAQTHGGGGAFAMRQFDAGDLDYATLRRVERDAREFLEYVRAWNRGVPGMWREHCAEKAAERAEHGADMLKAAKKLRAELSELFAELRSRAAVGNATCKALRLAADNMRRDFRILLADARAAGADVARYVAASGGVA